MHGYDPAMSFDDEAARHYDALAVRGDEPETVEFLARLAQGGPALELAIGTGRIALPLAARGVDLAGVDISRAMVERLRAKPGGDRLAVTIGDFADVPVDGTFRLVYVVFNTFFNLLSQDAQVRCFANVAAHLADDGRFVIEAFVPEPRWFVDGQYVDAEAVGVDAVRLDVARHDRAAQRLDESHVVLSPEGVRVHPIVTRYAWPSELDLMARLAGLRLHDRWAGWRDEPFTSASTRHVSVYGR